MTRLSTLPRKLATLIQSDQRRQANLHTVPESIAATKLGYLQEVGIFADLTPTERQWLVTNTAMVTCERGRVFYTPDQPGEVVFILKRGRVNLFRLDPKGHKLIIATLGAHTIFGEMGLIGQGMYGCYAEAAQDCLLCVLSRSDLKSFFRRNPDAALRFLDEMGKRLQEREASLEALAFRSIPVRLATLLLQEADTYGTIAGQTHQDLAERLGTYRETVSQTLGRFRDQGLVEIEPRRIRIVDPAGLHALVEH